MAKTILLIEDTDSDQRLARAALQTEGYTVHAASSAEEGLRLFEEVEPQLVLLDLVLPGMDGLAACRQLRTRSQVPIMMLTGKGEEVDKVIGLELGADDYLAKPYGVRELVARTRALLRRMESFEHLAIPQRHLSLPLLEIDLPTRTVRVAGQAITMTPKEFDLLYFLAAQPGRVFTRQEIMEKVWGYRPDEGSFRTIDTHIKRLRAKLEEEHQVPWTLATVWGVGYKFELKN
jgi:two-component system response regulator ResD